MNGLFISFIGSLLLSPACTWWQRHVWSLHSFGVSMHALKPTILLRKVQRNSEFFMRLNSFTQIKIFWVDLCQYSLPCWDQLHAHEIRGLMFSFQLKSLLPSNKMRRKIFSIIGISIKGPLSIQSNHKLPLWLLCCDRSLN